MQSFFENHLNLVMLVFNWIALAKNSEMSIPMCQGFNIFSGFLHHFVLAKLATSSIRVNYQDAPDVTGMICSIYCREIFQRGGLGFIF